MYVLHTLANAGSHKIRAFDQLTSHQLYKENKLRTA